MGARTQILADKATSGSMSDFYIELFNNYYPLGVFWLLIGVAIFSIIQIKTKNMAWSSGVTTVYFVLLAGSQLITNAYSQNYLELFGMFVGLVVLGTYLYITFKS